MLFGESPVDGTILSKPFQQFVQRSYSPTFTRELFNKFLGSIALAFQQILDKQTIFYAEYHDIRMPA